MPPPAGFVILTGGDFNNQQNHTMKPTNTPIDRVAIESTFTHFLVRSWGCWGKGKSIAEARRNCIKAGARKTDKMIAHWGTSDIECLSDGTVQATNMVFLGEV